MPDCAYIPVRSHLIGYCSYHDAWQEVLVAAVDTLVNLDATGVTVLLTGFLVAATTGLVVVTAMLWKSTHRLAAVTSTMATATVQAAQATTLRAELDYRSRIATVWSVRRPNVTCVTISDRRDLPMLIDAVYIGNSDDVTSESPTRIRLRRVSRWRCMLNRSEDEPLELTWPITLTRTEIQVLAEARVCYRDFGTRRNEWIVSQALYEVGPGGISVITESRSRSHFPGSGGEEDDEEYPAEMPGGEASGRPTDVEPLF